MKKLLSAVTSVVMSVSLMTGAFASSVSAAGSLTVSQPNVSMGEVLDVSAKKTASDGSVEWLIPTVVAAPGQTVTLPVIAKNSTLAVAGAQFKINAASPIVYKTVASGDAYASTIGVNNDIKKFLFDNKSGLGKVAPEDATVFTLAYTVPEDCKEGTYDIKWSDEFISDADGVDITKSVKFTNGAIKVVKENEEGKIQWVLDKVEATPGETVTLKAYVSNPDDVALAIAGAQYKINAETPIEYKSMKSGGAYVENIGENTELKKFLFEHNSGKGVVAANNATIMTLSYTVPENCDPGVYAVKWSDAFVSDTDGFDLTSRVSFVDGSITVKDTPVSGQVKWVIDNVKASKGETVTLNVKVEDTKGSNLAVAGAQFTIKADSPIKYDKAAGGSAYSGNFSANDDKNLYMFRSGSGKGTVAENNSNIMTLTYTVPTDCPNGVYPVKWSDAFVSDTDGFSLTDKVIFVDGSISIGDPAEGSVEWVIPTVQGEKGKDATLVVKVKGTADLPVAGAQFVIKDTDPVQYKSGEGKPYGAALSVNDDKQIFKFAQNNGKGKSAKDGDELFTLTYSVPADIADGIYPVTWDKQFVSDEDGFNITPSVKFVDGAIIIGTTTTSVTTTTVTTTTTTASTTTSTQTSRPTPEGGIKWIIDTVEAKPGQTVALNIKVSDKKNSALEIAGAQFAIKNPTDVIYDSISGSDAYGSKISFNNDKQKFLMANNAGKQVAAKDGDIVGVLTYTVPENCPEGVYPVSFAEGTLEIFDTDGFSLTDKIVGENGAIIVKIPVTETSVTGTTTSAPMPSSSSTSVSATTVSGSKTTESTTAGSGSKTTQSTTAVSGSKTTESTTVSGSKTTKNTSTSVSGSKTTESTTVVSGSKTTQSTTAVSGSKTTESTTAVSGSKTTQSTTAVSGSKTTQSTTAVSGSKTTQSTSAVSGSKTTESTSVVSGSKTTQSTTAVSGSKTTESTTVSGSKTTKNTSTSVSGSQPSTISTSVTTGVITPKQPIKWVVDEVKAYPGQEVTVKVRVKDENNAKLAIAGAQFKVVADGDVQLIKVGDKTAYGADVKPNDDKYMFMFATGSGKGHVAADGAVVVELTYKVGENVLPGTIIPVTLTDLFITDEDGFTITDLVKVEDGSIEVIQPNTESSTTISGTTTTVTTVSTTSGDEPIETSSTVSSSNTTTQSTTSVSGTKTTESTTAVSGSKTTESTTAGSGSKTTQSTTAVSGSKTTESTTVSGSKTTKNTSTTVSGSKTTESTTVSGSKTTKNTSTTVSGSKTTESTTVNGSKTTQSTTGNGSKTTQSTTVSGSKTTQSTTSVSGSKSTESTSTTNKTTQKDISITTATNGTDIWGTDISRETSTSTTVSSETTSSSSTTSTVSTTEAGYKNSYAIIETQVGYYFSHDNGIRENGKTGGFSKGQVKTLKIFDVYDDGREVERTSINMDLINYNGETPESIYNSRTHVPKVTTIDDFKYDVPVYYGNMALTDKDGNALTVTAYIGVKGDITLDNMVDAVDASAALRYYSLLSSNGREPYDVILQSTKGGLAVLSPTDELDELAAFLGDVNVNEWSEDNWNTKKNSRKVDANDASLILAFYAKNSSSDNNDKSVYDIWNEVLGTLRFGK